MLNKLRQACVCAALLGVAAAGGAAAWMFCKTATELDKITTMVETSLVGLQSSVDHVTKTVDVTSKETLRRADLITALADAQFTELSNKSVKLVGDTLTRVDNTLDEVKQIHADLKPTVDNVASITKHVDSMVAHVDDALPPFTDCAYLDDNGDPVGGNPDCVFNRFQAVSKATEKTMDAVAKASPKLAESAVGVGRSIDGIAADAHKEADEFLKPKTTRQKIADWLGMIPRVVKLVL